jgi:hypothetical protein
MERMDNLVIPIETVPITTGVNKIMNRFGFKATSRMPMEAILNPRLTNDSPSKRVKRIPPIKPKAVIRPILVRY